MKWFNGSQIIINMIELITELINSFNNLNFFIGYLYIILNLKIKKKRKVFIQLVKNFKICMYIM